MAVSRGVIVMGDCEGFVCKGCGMRVIPIYDEAGMGCPICGYIEEYAEDTDQ